jgi:hypothetical protein
MRFMIPGLKSETWGTHSFWNGQTWATRRCFNPEGMM